MHTFPRDYRMAWKPSNNARPFPYNTEPLLVAFFRTCATNIQGKWKEENGSWHAKWERHEGEWQEQRHFPLVFPAFWSSVSTNTYDILMFVYWDILHLYGGILTGGHSNLCCTELLFFTFFYPFKVSGRPYIYIHIKYIYIYINTTICVYIYRSIYTYTVIYTHNIQ